MSSLLKNIKFLGGSIVGNNNLLFQLNYYRKIYDNKILKTDSELCVEGFQRSGNSFLVLMLRRSNKGIKLAHHMHVSSQVIRSTKRSVPTVVLIRKPEDALASLITWDDRLSDGVAIKAYCDFYKKIQHVKRDFLLIKFEELILDFNQVVDKVNARFDTSFNQSDWTKDRIEKEMNNRNIVLKNDKSSPFPNELKTKFNTINRERISKHPNFQEAQRIYLSYLNG